MKKIVFLIFFCFSQLAFAKKSPNLTLSQSSIVLAAETEETKVQDENGIHLFVKKQGDIKSVALVRVGETGSGREILRAKEYNPINGDEKFKNSGKKMNFNLMKTDFALIATKTEKHDILGECFHIYIPQKVMYGSLPNAKAQDFSFKNLKIRAYAMPYCDYSSEYKDFDLSGSDDVASELAFFQIASETGGELTHIESVSELTKQLLAEIDGFDSAEKTELVFAIDATDSMKDDFAELRKNWLPKFEKQIKNFRAVKIGLLFYKDYGDEYDTKGLPIKNLRFLKNASAFSKAVKNARVKGGGDREEAVWEALYSCATGFDWSENAKKKVILVGDAPPRANDDGKFSLESSAILKNLADKKISVDCFLISDYEESVAVMKTVEKSQTAAELLKAVDAFDAK